MELMRGRTIRLASKSPARVSELPQESTIPAGASKDSLPQETPKKSNKSISVSRRHDEIREEDNAKGIQKGRGAMDELLAELYSQIGPFLSQNQKNQINELINEIEKASSFQNYLVPFFRCYNSCFAIKLQARDRAAVKSPQDLKLRKKLLLSADKSNNRSSKRMQLEVLSSENEQLKKQLFRLKQSSLHLQKRILQLVAQYKDRKMVYLSEIHKLATIINSSIREIPQLIMRDRPPHPRRASSAQKLLPDELTLTRKDSEYNTISTSEALRWGLENTYRVIKGQGPPGDMQRDRQQWK